MFALLWRLFWLRQALRLFRAVRRDPGMLRDHRRMAGPLLWLLLFRHHRWAPMARRLRYF